MADPLLLWENILDEGTITADEEAAGFPVENVLDWRPATGYRWKATDTTSLKRITVDLGAGNTSLPDTVAFAGHNLKTAGGTTVLVRSSTDNFSASDDVQHTVTIADDNPHLETFTAAQGARRYWRIELTDPGTWSAVTQMGVVTLGRKLDIPEGAPLNLDPYHFDPQTEWTLNEGGSMLGANHRFIHRRFNFNYDSGSSIAKTDFFQPASGPTFDEQLWAGGTEDSFLDHAKSKPFWYAWNITAETRMAFICRLASAVRMPFVGTTNRRALRCTVEAAGQS